MSARPKIGVTMGDPAGIGPEIVVKTLAMPEAMAAAELVVYGSSSVIAAAAAKFAAPMPTVKAVVDLDFKTVPIGRADAKCGLAAMNSVTAAVEDALAGRIDALVTAPMNKASVNLAGVPFTGHTELIAEMCEALDYAMMQSAGDLRVAFVTTHIPLAEVASAITRERIVKVGELLAAACRDEGVSHPRLAVMAINPHAGEDGFMGGEDESVVRPAIRELASRGTLVEGPFPPDTMFLEPVRRRFAGIVSMYHDQGHIPFKMLAFDRGVNSTLGLPIIRASVDHGTAFDIAWRGEANTGSLFEAVKLAVRRAENRAGRQ